jgi:hypothetical protein
VLRDATLLEALATKAFTSEFAFKLDDEISAARRRAVSRHRRQRADRLGREGNEPGRRDDRLREHHQDVLRACSRAACRARSGSSTRPCWPQLFKMYSRSAPVACRCSCRPTALSDAPYGTLMGLPVNVIEQASALGTVGDIILANFSNDYALISKPMTSASSIHVLFTSNQTTFRWVWPVIGKPVLSSAITPYKGADTSGRSSRWRPARKSGADFH